MQNVLRKLFSVGRKASPSLKVVRGEGHPAIAKLKLAMNGDLPESAEVYFSRIEALRAHMLRDDTPLSWERPWLATSEELRKRIKVDDADQSFSTTITTATAAKASRAPEDCRSLMALVLAFRPATVLEMGTNVGISGAAIASGLALNNHGRLVTLEGARMKGDLAARNFARLGLTRVQVVVGDFADTLEGALAQCSPLDLSFIDGFHEGAATVRYHRMCKAVANEGAVLVYDDITWSDGMKHAWQEILADDDVKAAVEVGNLGICVLG